MKSVATAVVFMWMAFALGCSNKTAPTGGTQSLVSEKNTEGSGPVVTTSAAKLEPATVKVAEGIAKELQEGKLKASQLTPAFKKLIAPATTEADKAQGYSDWGAESWLAEHTKGMSAEQVQGLALDANTMLVTSKAKSGTGGRALLRLVKSGSTYLVDWVDVVQSVSEFDFTVSPAAAFTAAAFLDTVLTKQNRLAGSLMAATGAKKIAPPLDDADVKQGYNAGILSIKFNNFRSAATGAEQLKLVKDGVGYTLNGMLTGGGVPRSFSVKVVLVGSQWLVEEFVPN